MRINFIALDDAKHQLIPITLDRKNLPERMILLVIFTVPATYANE